jgi:hypothetical protein
VVVFVFVFVRDFLVLGFPALLAANGGIADEGAAPSKTESNCDQSTKKICRAFVWVGRNGV